MAAEKRKRRGRRYLLAAAATALLGTSLAAGVASAGPKDRIEAAEEKADALGARIEQRNGTLTRLEDRVTAARARIDGLTGLLERGEQRSSELSVELGEAEAELRESQERLNRARGVLADRLVAIYKGADPDYLDLVLGAADFEDLTARADYLRAIEEADQTIVERVDQLKGEVEDRFEQVADSKAAVDDHNRQLVAARSEVSSLRASLERRAGQLAAAQERADSTLAELRSNIETWRAELGADQTAALFGDGGWAIPSYIVMCESGGNFRAYNPSSGAGGAYQIIPSTWKAYGGKGLAHMAPPAEQHRIAALIWRDSGPSAWSCA